jgi:hypothetical protein
MRFTYEASTLHNDGGLGPVDRKPSDLRAVSTKGENKIKKGERARQKMSRLL